MWSRRADWTQAGLLAALAYIPIFCTRVGQVAADTKEYLYLDPAKLTTGAASMWDPNTGLGTVTHQNIGYLLPMGPYYTAISWLGVPMWVGQRIWMGSLLFFAGTGVLYCARRLGLEGPGRFVAAIAYMLSPYTLDYLDRISAILMPWAALGWMIGLTIGAARSGRWRHAALFALVVALVGGVNATSIVMVIAAPAAWLVYATWVTREVTVRRAVTTGIRLGVLCVAVSLWWVAGLWAEGKYGINILRVTETVPTVSKTSSAAEVLRGLGYWYFYGWDKVQPWTLQAVPYTQSPGLLALSLGLPGLAIFLGMITRWAYRGYCLVVVGLGTVVAVGAFPFSDPSLFGAIIKGASAGSSLALAMRSVDRIVPIVVVGLALLMGSGVTALHLRRPTTGLVAGGVSVVLLGVNLPALWTGGLIASNLSRPETLPSYWTEAASYLNSFGSSSRVLGLPGEDFAAYSWGVTEDPVPPGLLSRPYVSRQAVPAGTPASANLLQALDEPIQEGTIDPAAIAPVARLMSAGQILLQSDLQYERYHLPFPQILYGQLTSAQAGLGAPQSFGAPNPAPQIRYPLNTELRLGIPTGTPEPPALSVFDVTDPRSLVRTESSTDPVILAGDGAGVVEAAGAGLLDGDGSIFYAAALKSKGSHTRALTTGPATLILTDTNPLTTYLWGTLQANQGEIQQPGVPEIEDNPSDYSLPLFPGETAADQTVAEVSGVASVRATQYGDSLTFTPEFKPLNAFDGNPATAWAFGAHEPVTGIRLDARLLAPVTTDHVTLHQIGQLGSVRRRITAVTLKFDGGHAVRVALTSASLSPAGQTVSFPTRTFSDFQLIVDGATGGKDKRYDGLPQVGFSEITIPGVGAASETRRLPTDLLDTVPNSIDDPLDILMQRSRVVGTPRQDPEPTMSRTFSLPSARSFSVGGTAEINAADSDYLIDQLIGVNRPTSASSPGSGAALVLSANSSTRLVGDRAARANAAVDGDPATAWIAETGHQVGEWLSFDLSKSISFDHLDLQVLNDGRHSLPSRITITTESGSRTVNVPVPAVGTGRAQNATSSVAVTFPALSGSTVKVTIDAIRPVEELDYYSTFAGLKDVLPVGIAELGLPGVVQPATPAQVPSSCTGALLQIDGAPIDLRVTGSTADALGGQQLTVEPCGNSLDGIHLGAGTHTVTTSPHLPSGWSVDQVWLGSGAGGAAVPVGAAGTGEGTPQAAAAQVVAQNRTSLTVKVHTTGSPQWLVLGQSFSAGWHASVSGGADLGGPQLIDAYANGWYLPAQPAGRTLVIDIDWRPQTVIWTALSVSAASILLCVALAIWPEGGRGVLGRRGRARRPRRQGYPPTPASVNAFVRLDRPHRGPPRGVALSAVVAWGLVTSAVSRPVIGLLAAAALGTAMWWRRGRLACRLASLLVLLALPVYVVSQQILHRYWPDISWPGEMSSANDLAWMGLALVGCDLVAGAVYARFRMEGSE